MVWSFQKVTPKDGPGSNPTDVGSLAVEEPPWLVNMGTLIIKVALSQCLPGSFMPKAEGSRQGVFTVSADYTDYTD